MNLNNDQNIFHIKLNAPKKFNIKKVLDMILT